MDSNMIFKLCAVPYSLLLVAAFVSYRAGALDSLRKPTTTAIETPVAPEYIQADEALPEVLVTPNEARSGDQLMPGSKSAAVLITPEEVFNTPEATPQPIQPALDSAEGDPIFFSGSKSLMTVPPKLLK